MSPGHARTTDQVSQSETRGDCALHSLGTLRSTTRRARRRAFGTKKFIIQSKN